jgi:hypothetical protein
MDTEMEEELPPLLVNAENVPNAPNVPPNHGQDSSNGELQQLPSKVEDLQLSRVPITIVTGTLKSSSR